MINKLKVLRAIKGINQEELASTIGVTLSTYSKKENSKTEFTLKEANKIAKFFGRTIEDIFFNDEVNF